MDKTSELQKCIDRRNGDKARIRELKGQLSEMKTDDMLEIEAQIVSRENLLESAERSIVRPRGDSKAFLSDDYAVLRCKPYRFYFGYEYTTCPLHGNDACCDNCEKKEWAFVVWRNVSGGGREEVFRLPASDLDTTDVEYAILHGIGIFLNVLQESEGRDDR